MRALKKLSSCSYVVVCGLAAALALAPAAFAAEPMALRPNPAAVGGGPADGPTGGPVFILDDGTYENSIGLTNQVTNNSAVFLNRFTPATYPETIDIVQILWPTSTDALRNLVGDTVTILIYTDTDGDGNAANAVLSYQESFVIGIQDGTTFENYDLTGNPTFAGPGDLYIGYRDDWNLGGATAANFPAALDQTASQGRSWVAGNTATGVDVDINNLGANTLIGIVDNFGLPGNWMIRAVGGVVYVPPVTQEIPTASTLGLAALALLLAGAAFVAFRRHG